MYIDQEKLFRFIIDTGLITQDEYEHFKELADTSKQKLQQVLVSQGKVKEEDMIKIESYLSGVPFIDLVDKKIPSDILYLIPEPIARKHNIVAIGKKDNTLEVALLDADDLPVIDFVKKKTGLQIVPRLTNVESMKQMLLQYQKSLKVDFGNILQDEVTGAMQTLSETDPNAEMSPEDLRKMAEDLPIVRIVETLLKHAVIQNASDIHVEHTEAETVIRYRIDGMLHDAMILPKATGPSIVARIKVLASLKLDEKRLPQDGRFKIELNGEKVSFRVSILPTYYGEKIVMRLLREAVSGFTLEGLGFHGQSLEHIHEAINFSDGMILTTGPTGSGKTTTLYTVLDILNTPDVNISTVEDPVEYQIKRINQTAIRSDIGFTFATGLRSLLRQDPDVIMVGEIRDNETAALAINAALTGHLVLSTLHTNSAAGAIPRLIDMKCEPFLIVSTTKVIVAQRLIRQLSDTKEEYTLSDAEIASIKKKVDLDRVMEALKEEKIVAKNMTWEKMPFFKPGKVTETNSGYAGRLGIHEVLKVSPAIKDLIMTDANADKIEEQAKKEGMMTMLEDGIFKAAQGLTSIEEVLRIVSE